MKNSFKKIFLIILDGFGLAPANDNNPVTRAGMPALNSLIGKYKAFNIVASGLVVGLPWGKPGNSEVGHSAIGTGRVIVQDWARINNDIRSGDFYNNPAFVEAAQHCKKYNSTFHIIGCTSPGGIHAHEDHAIALLEFAAREKLSRVCLHMITDGEDSGPVESLATLQRLKPHLENSGAHISTIMGRTYAMDRVYNWELTKNAWDAMVNGKGQSITDAFSYIQFCHQRGTFDELIPPVVFKDALFVDDNDSVVFFNYRNDRAKQMLMPFVISDFKEFEREKVPKNLFVVTMTRYSSQIPANAVAFEAADIHHTLGKEVDRRGFRQFRIAEKEKESHINNFFNGGRIDPYDETEQIIVSSKPLKGTEYLKHPEMSASQITDQLLSRVDKDFIFYLANFANSDMMAHTGNLQAAVNGLKVLDECIQKISENVLKYSDCGLVITCDHGNCEEMIDPATGGPDTQHSTNNVFALFAGKGLESEEGLSLDLLANMDPTGSLIDIAPTILHMLSFEKPIEMTGNSLL